MKNLLVFNEQTHSLDDLSEFDICKNGKYNQITIPAIFTKDDLEALSDSLINEMTRLRSAYIDTKEIREAVKNRLTNLSKLHSKICNLIF